MRHHRSWFAIAAAAGLAASARAQTNVLQNGDFETGDLSGWGIFGDETYIGVDDFSQHSGTYGAYFGPFDPAGIQQTITANPGDQAVVSFWLWVEQDFNTTEVDFDNRTLISLTDIAEPYTFYSFTVTVAGANPTLTFTFTNPPDFTMLDDVMVVITPAPPVGCYVNCDGSTLSPFLNIADFVCFQQKFAAGDSYANCDASTLPPILNIADFVCFQQRFAAGCSAP